MEAPLTFRKNGFQYKLIQPGTRACIYEQLYSENPHVSYFEVFSLVNEKGKERIRKGGERWGKVYEDSFPTPGNEDFGKTAWVFADLNKARVKFQELEREGEIERKCDAIIDFIKHS